MKIAYKILLFVAIPTIFGCVGIIYKDYFATHQLLTHLIRIHLNAELDIQETKIRNFFAHHIATLQFIAHQPAIKEKDDANIPAYLASQRAALKSPFSTLFLATPSGHIKIVEGAHRSLPSQQDIFESRPTGGTGIVTMPSSAGGPSSAVIIVPVINQQEVVGYLGGVVSLSELSSRRASGLASSPAPSPCSPRTAP